MWFCDLRTENYVKYISVESVWYPGQQVFKRRRIITWCNNLCVCVCQCLCVSGSNATIPVWSETPVTSEWNHAAVAVLPAVNHVIDVWGEEWWSDCQCRPSLCNSYLTPAVSLLCTKMFCRISPPFYSLSPSGGYCVYDRGSIWFSVFL